MISGERGLVEVVALQRPCALVRDGRRLHADGQVCYPVRGPGEAEPKNSDECCRPERPDHPYANRKCHAARTDLCTPTRLRQSGSKSEVTLLWTGFGAAGLFIAMVPLLVTTTQPLSRR